MNIKKKNKIAMLVPRYGIVERGVEVFTEGFVRYLSGEYEIVVFSRKKSKPHTRAVWAIAEENWFLQKIYGFHPRLKNLLDRFHLNPLSIEMLTFSIACFPFLVLEDYDLLFPQNGVWGAIVSRVVRGIRGTPFVYRSAGGKEPVIVRQKPNLCIATTPTIKRFIRKIDNKANVRLIANAVELKKFSRTNKPIHVELEKPVVICVGALFAAKRVELTVRAVSKLKRGSLLVLGDGPDKEKIIRLGKRLLGKKRFLVDYVSHDDISSYYGGSNIFTLASVDEPFGIVYLEAMAANLPVVAPNDETRRFIVGKAGTYFKEDNLEEYVKTLGKAIETEFGQIPRKQAEKFDWNKIANIYKNELIDVIRQ